MVTKPTKYTKEFVKQELDLMLSELGDNQRIYLLEGLTNKRPYSKQRFSEWAKKFKDDEEISEAIKKVKDILEYRLNQGGLENKLNPTMSIFNLKNHYGWKDRTETDVTSLGHQLGYIALPPLKPA